MNNNSPYPPATFDELTKANIRALAGEHRAERYRSRALALVLACRKWRQAAAEQEQDTLREQLGISEKERNELKSMMAWYQTRVRLISDELDCAKVSLTETEEERDTWRTAAKLLGDGGRALADRVSAGEHRAEGYRALLIRVLPVVAVSQAEDPAPFMEKLLDDIRVAVNE